MNTNTKYRLNKTKRQKIYTNKKKSIFFRQLKGCTWKKFACRLWIYAASFWHDVCVIQSMLNDRWKRNAHVDFSERNQSNWTVFSLSLSHICTMVCDVCALLQKTMRQRVRHIRWVRKYSATNLMPIIGVKSVCLTHKLFHFVSENCTASSSFVVVVFLCGFFAKACWIYTFEMNYVMVTMAATVTASRQQYQRLMIMKIRAMD